MESIFMAAEGGRVHVLKFGNGPQMLVAFPGYADRAALFLPLEAALTSNFKVFAVDLPFHGQTEWHKADFNRQDLLGIIQDLMQREGKNTCSVMGFSFGARLSLGLLAEPQLPFDHLYLLAPDGIRTKGMGLLENMPHAIIKLLFKLLQRPESLLAFTAYMVKTGLLTERILRFLHRHLGQPQRIKRSFGCWLSLKHFRIKRRQVRQKLIETGLPVEIFVGSEDPLIRAEVLEWYFEGLPGLRFCVLPGEGHDIIGSGLSALLGELR